MRTRARSSIGTTHMQARYVLPAVIREFRARYPNVQFHLYQGTSEQIAEMAQTNRIDSGDRDGLRPICSATMCCCRATSGIDG